MDPNTPRAEAERWLGIAVKLLTARDFLGSKTFAIRARESDPNNQVPDQILAVIETVLAGEKRVNSSQHPDWYTVLQLPRLVRDSELIANHYRKLVTLLNPDRNRVPFADYALQLVMDAWSILSDPNKKWLFDNELAVYLQRIVEEQQQQIPQQQQQQQQSQQQQQPQSQSQTVAAVQQQQQQINTFQFFQPPPQQQLQQQQQLPQAAGSMWQQQEDHFSQNNNFSSGGGSGSNQLQQIEFMQMQQQLPLRPQQQPMQLPPQWQMRDPTPSKGGERNKGVVNAIAGSGLGMSALQGTSANATVPVITTPIMQTQMMPIPGLVQAQQPSVVVPVQHQTHPVEMRTTLVDGNVGIGNVVHSRLGNNNNASVVHENNDAFNANANVDNGDVAANEGNKGGEKEVESFWTSCPYCLYIFEYQIVYKECTLRCQNCGRGFHAVQIPNPPPISDGGDGGGEKGKDSKESSFCCWGFFPLGFSSVAWKKQNKMGKSNVGTNWVPFSPMFACPVENGSEKFQWFDSSGGAAVGPKKMVRPQPSQPRVYFDDDLDDFNSDPSDSDSSDDDWRRQRHNAPEKKKKKKRRRKVRTGRPPNHRHGVVNVQKQGNHKSATERGVSARGNHLEGGSNTPNVVVFSLAAGATKEDARRRVATATLTRNQARRRTKNMGRLDLNVEFNNEGDEQAPTASAVNGGEVGVENIEFFEGLDEFFSTLPILNVDGDEKAKPS